MVLVLVYCIINIFHYKIKGNYEEYINDICWVSNTYYISLDQKLPEAEQIRKNFELKYYQWVSSHEFSLLEKYSIINHILFFST